MYLITTCKTSQSNKHDYFLLRDLTLIIIHLLHFKLRISLHKCIGKCKSKLLSTVNLYSQSQQFLVTGHWKENCLRYQTEAPAD